MINSHIEFYPEAKKVGTLKLLAPLEPIGGKYNWACTAVIYDHRAKLCGVLKAPTPSQWRTIAKLLRAEGISEVHWERRNIPLARFVTIYI